MLTDPVVAARAVGELRLFCCGVILVASSIYGATVGWWQASMQGFYAALKFPVLIFATVGGNALLNWMLAQVIGLTMSFRESWLAILMSFVIATLILAAFAPVSLFLAWSAPAVSSVDADQAYSVVLLTHVVVIAYAGVAANVRLLQLLRVLNGSREAARRVLLAWLTGNLLVGTQVSWIISPFIGSPHKPLMFIQEHPFQRNFFEYAYERGVICCARLKEKESDMNDEPAPNELPPGAINPRSVVELLLKRPRSAIGLARMPDGRRLLASLVVLIVAGATVYGLVAGTSPAENSFGSRR